jgi:hypothetical protein
MPFRLVDKSHFSSHFTVNELHRRQCYGVRRQSAAATALSKALKPSRQKRCRAALATAFHIRVLFVPQCLHVHRVLLGRAEAPDYEPTRNGITEIIAAD